MEHIAMDGHFGYRRLLKFVLPCIFMMIVTSVYSSDWSGMKKPVESKVCLRPHFLSGTVPGEYFERSYKRKH